MEFEFSKRSVKNMEGVDQRLVDLFIEALSLSPIDFGIPETGGLRTAEVQHDLFVNGKSKCDGYLNKSRHQTGKALDVFAYINGRASWDNEHLAIIAGVVLSCAKRKKLKVTWGGSFGSAELKGWDRPHFQLED